MNAGNKPIPSHALKGDSSSGCDPSIDRGVVPGNYGFVYTSPEVVRKLSAFMGSGWNSVGAISLVVDASGAQFFQFCTDDFRRLSLVPLSRVMGAGMGSFSDEEDILS